MCSPLDARVHVRRVCVHLSVFTTLAGNRTLSKQLCLYNGIFAPNSCIISVYQFAGS